MFDGLKTSWWYLITVDWQQSQNVKLYMFWWEMLLNNSINITFTWCINHILLLNTFLFFFFITFLLINLIFFFFKTWIVRLDATDQLSSCFWVSSYFWSIFWMLWMLVTVRKDTFTLRKTWIMLWDMSHEQTEIKYENIGIA